MKKYDVKVEKIITTVFTLEAKNKMEAEEMVKDVIYNSCILELNAVKKDLGYNFVINKQRKGKRKWKIIKKLSFI